MSCCIPNYFAPVLACFSFNKSGLIGRSCPTQDHPPQIPIATTRMKPTNTHVAPRPRSFLDRQADPSIHHTRRPPACSGTESMAQAFPDTFLNGINAFNAIIDQPQQREVVWTDRESVRPIYTTSQTNWSFWLKKQVTVSN